VALPGAVQLASTGMSIAVTYSIGTGLQYGPPFSSDHDLVLDLDGAGEVKDAYRVEGQKVISTFVVGPNWPTIGSKTQSFDLGSRPLVIKELYRYDDSDFQQRVFHYVDPASAGLNYLTYGSWLTSGFTQPDLYEGFSAGALTPNTAIPTSGSAKFDGALAAFGVNNKFLYGVAAPVTINVDFSSRAATFNSTDFHDAQGTIFAGTALSGVLSYASQQNALTGQLTSATFSGPANAHFYGPGAEEIGGAFALKPTTSANPGGIVGGFGAKR
jgi:hypothetical protein